MKAEEAVVNLSRDRVGRHEVVEEPLLAKPANVGVEDREGVLWVQSEVSTSLARQRGEQTNGAEVVGLIDGDEEVLDL